MAKLSAGILLYRFADRADRGAPELLLGHMGGPLWARKDDQGWSIPKGEPDPDEELLDAARREFGEELGSPVPDVELRELGSSRQSGGKVVTIWAGEADFDAEHITPGTFTMPWPPRSGRSAEFPEIDRAGWFPPEVARVKLVKGQVVFVDRLLELLASG